MCHGIGWMVACGLVLLACTFPGAHAETIRLELEFTEPALQGADDPGSLVTMPGCVTLGSPGAPLLPAREAAVLLPPGEVVTAVRALPGEARPLAGRHDVAAAQEPRPISQPGPFPATAPDPAIYDHDGAYPAAAAHLVTEQTAWGHGVAFFQVHPVVYRPASGELAWYERITLEIDTAPREGFGPVSSLPNLRRTDTVRHRLASMVDNPDMLDRYEGCLVQRADGSRLDPDDYPYVIVTAAEFAETFGELATYASSRGLRAVVVTLDEVGVYPGDDLAMQLRNFIIDAYQSWETEYVVLGGDYDVVPIRPLYVDAGGTIDQFPGDCYYEGLDGNWNTDGDEHWGEDGEYDLIGEVAVGRVSINHASEFTAWFRKNRMYVEEPVVEEIQKALFLGEQLDDIPTWGGNYMDELKDYCCTHGYCTSGYPNTYLKETLYDRDGAWSKWDVIDLFNSGFPTSHHLGHSGTTYCMKMGNADTQYFTNDGVTHSFCFMASQGCYDNNFDNSGSDAISEAFLFAENAAPAFLGNTRYGWYVMGATSGPSQHYDRQFVDARYEEGIETIGWMNVDSKVDNIWMLNPWNLWCHYELCLMGDPAMPQWSGFEGHLELAHWGGYVIGQGEYEVTVLRDGEPVDGATVTLYSDDLGVWASATSGPDGVAAVTPDPHDPMTLNLKAVKTGYLPASGTVEVAPAEGPWLVWQATAVDDDQAGPSMGDGDGLVDLGETVQLLITLQNVGAEDALDASLELTCEDERVTITDGTAAYGTIPAGGIGSQTDDLVVTISSEIADGDIIEFDLTLSSQQRWAGTDDFTLTLHAPVLSIAGWEIDDTATGDGQGDLDPGETVELTVTLLNSGSDEGREVAASLSCDNLFLNLDPDPASVELIPCAGTGDLAPPIRGRLDIHVPTDEVLDLVLSGETWAGQAFSATFQIPVASLYENAFETEDGWVVGVPDDNATAGIWTRVDPVGSYFGSAPVAPEDDHTPDGTHCFVTEQGGVGQPARESDVDGGKTTLRSPVLDLGSAVNPRLLYWRWYANHLGPFPGEDYWQVDVSADGGDSWVNLEYTNEGTAEWQLREFYLEDYIALTGEVVLRFVASDYGSDSLIEAALDDVSIESQPSPAAIEGNGGAGPQRRFALGAVSPSPLRLGAAGGAASAGHVAQLAFSLPRTGDVNLQVFGIDGGLVRTLAGGRHQPGEHRVSWDGRDASGNHLASGVYFVRLQGLGQEASRRLVVLR